MEVWKKIPGYEEYEVSSLGKVRGQYGKILSPWKSKGYDIVWICKDTIKRKIGVHRLVAWAFLENPENKPTVDHLNRNRTDNRVACNPSLAYNTSCNAFWISGLSSLSSFLATNG
jgi:hypothetical protein